MDQEEEEEIAQSETSESLSEQPGPSCQDENVASNVHDASIERPDIIECDNNELVYVTDSEQLILHHRRRKMQKLMEKNRLDKKYVEIVAEGEVMCLRMIYLRHKTDTMYKNIDNNIPIAILKRNVTKLFMDLLFLSPQDQKLWDQFVNFHKEFKIDNLVQRTEFYYDLVENSSDEDLGVYHCIALAEFTITEDYSVARQILRVGVVKHTDFSLYLRLFELEIAHCNKLRRSQVDDACSAETKSIILGDFVFDAYKRIKNNFGFTEKEHVEKVKHLLDESWELCLCRPVLDLREVFQEDLKAVDSNNPYVVDILPYNQLTAVTEQRYKPFLVKVFNVYFDQFKVNLNADVLHKMIRFYQTIINTSQLARRALYMLFEVGLHMRLLKPEHIFYWMELLMKENNHFSKVKVKYIFRMLDSDQINCLQMTWNIKFNIFIELYGFDEKRMQKCMLLTEKALKKNVLPSCMYLFIRTLLDRSAEAEAFIKFVFKYIKGINYGPTKKELNICLVNLLLFRNRITNARYEYLKLLGINPENEAEDDPPSYVVPADFHTQVLGNALQYCITVKQEPTEDSD